MTRETEASHDDYLALLPWYVNESLSEKERVHIMEHLSECSVCRTERDQLQLLQDSVQRQDLEVSDYRFSFSKLMKRIDASEENRESAEELNDFDQRSSWDMRWPLFATAASLVLGVFLLANIGPAVEKNEELESTYRTLSQVSLQSGLPHRVKLSFDDSLGAHELREILSGLQSTMVSGPSDDGIYIVDLNVPVQQTDAEFMNNIREKEGVRYAVYASAHSNP